MNKLTLKDETISYWFTLFIFGGPCHLPISKHCSGDLIFLCEQLVYPATELLHFLSQNYIVHL